MVADYGCFVKNRNIPCDFWMFSPTHNADWIDTWIDWDKSEHDDFIVYKRVGGYDPKIRRFVSWIRNNEGVSRLHRCLGSYS